MGTPERSRGPAGPPGAGTWIIDLDGVVWLAGEAIAGSPDAVARLRRSGRGVLFATNNSSPTVAELLARLDRIGIPAGPGDVVTSAQAAAGLVAPGSRVLTLADRGVREALAGRGAVVVEAPPADVVVVGWTRHFDFDGLAAAATAVRDGALLVGTNEDATHPTPSGLLPGSGALLAAVATAAGVDPTVAGKPHAPMADLVRARAPDAEVVVGDRPATDGLLAERLGVPFALVLSGVTAGGDAAAGSGARTVAPDLAGAVAALLD